MSKLPYTFRGLIAPTLAPFLHDSTRTVNLSIIPQYAEFLAKRGINGVLVNGTTGEGPSMNVNERKAVTEAWAAAVKSTKQHLMVQIGGTSLPDVLELAKHAENVGVDAILCLPELYYKPTTPEHLVEYLRKVSEVAPSTPLLYYHIPIRTNVEISMPKFLKAVGDRISTFVGIKFTSSNLGEAVEAIHVNKNFVVFLGSEKVMSGALTLGIDSFISSAFNVFPELAISVLSTSAEGDIAKCKELQEKISSSVDAIAKHGIWIEALKVAMRLLTPLDIGPPRSPFTALSPETVAAMKTSLEAMGHQTSKYVNED